METSDKSYIKIIRLDRQLLLMNKERKSFEMAEGTRTRSLDILIAIHP